MYAYEDFSNTFNKAILRQFLLKCNSYIVKKIFILTKQNKNFFKNINLGKVFMTKGTIHFWEHVLIYNT